MHDKTLTFFVIVSNSAPTSPVQSKVSEVEQWAGREFYLFGVAEKNKQACL